MSEKFTNKQLTRIKELERLVWNEALVAAKAAVIGSGLYYKDGVNCIDDLRK